MVHNGKNHKQAMGAVMSHIGARILAVLRENKPYELRDVQGKPITWEEAKKLIQLNYHVPEEIKRDRRRRRTLGDPVNRRLGARREMLASRVREAGEAPQSAVASPSNQFN